MLLEARRALPDHHDEWGPHRVLRPGRMSGRCCLQPALRRRRRRPSPPPRRSGTALSPPPASGSSVTASPSRTLLHASGWPLSASRVRRPAPAVPAGEGRPGPAHGGEWVGPAGGSECVLAIGGPTVFPGLRHRPAPDRHGPARRLAGHRGSGPGGRRRLHPPRRPSQGPDHPGRSQHRTGGHRELLLLTAVTGPGGGSPGRARRWGAGGVRHARPRRHRDPRGGPWAAQVRRPSRRAATQAVTVLDAIPVTLVGKPFKPALRAEATQRPSPTLRHGALPRSPARGGAVEDGAVVSAVVGPAPGADETSVRDTLNRFAITWRLELS